jgi:hypothetical protein
MSHRAHPATIVTRAATAARRLGATPAKDRDAGGPESRGSLPIPPPPAAP